MSKQSEGDCHRCGHAAQWNREFRCPRNAGLFTTGI